MLPKKRNKNRRKRIAAVLVICGVLAIVAVFAAGIWKQQRKAHMEAESDSVSSEENTSEGITYKGKTYVYNDHLSNYLFMGIDTRGDMETAESGDAGQADAVFLVSVDRVTKEMQVISIPRDTMTEIEMFSVSRKSLGLMENHINLQYAQGDGKTESCELMKTAVSNLLNGLPVQGYCAMNMDGISVITDYVGGVEITVPDNSLEDINPDFKEGSVVTLTGENAEQFVRYRDIGKSQSALVRQERQKTYLQAFLQKAQEQASKDAGFVTGLYDSIDNYTVTNMGNDVFAKLLTASQNEITDSRTVPGEGTQGENFDEYHVDEDELTDMIISMFYNKN